MAVTQCAQISARYAATAQMAGLVPIIEPDVMLDGDHDIFLCQKVTERVLVGIALK
jgi:fructose-bisphosphate aldolase class I